MAYMGVRRVRAAVVRAVTPALLARACDADDTDHVCGSLSADADAAGDIQRDQAQHKKMRPRPDAATDGDRLARDL
jgi:hypothetical protein